MKKLFKIIFVILLAFLDWTLFAVLAGRYFFVSVSFLILALFLDDPLFGALAAVLAIMLGLFSAMPWFLFTVLFLVWALLVKKLSKILFAGRSVSSFAVFYLVSYGLFDLIFLAARVMIISAARSPYSLADFLSELRWQGIGLLIGFLVTAAAYLALTYIEKKFQSLFFVRRR